jgi:hypothetical protein
MTDEKVRERAAAESISRASPRLVREVVSAVLTGAIACGDLSFKGKTAEEIRNETQRFRRLLARGRIKILPVIDHRNDLLREARTFLRHSDWNLALLLYATYFEHAVNSLLAMQARRRRFSKDALLQMIREVSLPAKMGWVLELLGMKPINSVHRKRLLKLAELRNAFVHYKWLPKTDSDVALFYGKLDPVTQSLKDVEKTVSYLRRYEEQMFYEGQRKHVRTIVRRISKRARASPSDEGKTVRSV